MKLKDYSIGKDTICACGSDEFESIGESSWKCSKCGQICAYIEKSCHESVLRQVRHILGTPEGADITIVAQDIMDRLDKGD